MMYGLFITYDYEGYSDGTESQFELRTFSTFEKAEQSFKELIEEWIDNICHDEIPLITKEKGKIIAKAMKVHKIHCSEFSQSLYNSARIEKLEPNKFY